MYERFALFYDRLTGEVDYEARAAMADRLLREKHGAAERLRVSDLACGTGTLSLALARRGYDVVGIDASADMLAVAQSKAGDAGVFFTMQDMRSFRLYAPCACVVSSQDAVNYLLTPADVKSCFSAVYGALEPGGLFLFDVNTLYYFENILAGRAFILEEEGVFCVWQNDYNPKTRLCAFELSFFENIGSDRYRRFDEYHRERAYTERQLRAWLAAAGFSVRGIYGDASFGAPAEASERLFFVTEKE